MTDTFKLVPKVKTLKYRYHRNLHCSKFTELNRQKQADSIKKSNQNFNSVNKKFKSASIRSTTKKVTNGLSPVKRAKKKTLSLICEKKCNEKKVIIFFNSFTNIVCFIIAIWFPGTC